MIERVFGTLKNSYSSVGVLCYRGNKHIGPLICNVTASLFNRKKHMFQDLRDRSGLQYMP